MDVLSQNDMDARMSSARALNKDTPSGLPNDLWCIPAPWEDGTFISLMRAKVYAAELRALISEKEREYLKHEFDREVERNKRSSENHAKDLERMSAEHSRVCTELRRLRLQNKKGRR
jgi:hypothetical protein